MRIDLKASEVFWFDGFCHRIVCFFSSFLWSFFSFRLRMFMTSLETLTTVVMMVLVRWFPSVRIRERLSSVWESWLVVGVGFSLLYFLVFRSP